MPARQLRAALATAALLAAFAAGCGGDDASTTSSATSETAPPPAATSTGPVATAPAATQPPTDATEPPPAAAPRTTPSGGATAPGDDGRRDAPEQQQEPVRVPATFQADGGTLTPSRITVPAFLAVELSVASADGRAHTVVVATPSPARVEVPAGGRGTVRLPGLRAGEYAIELDGRGAGTLVAGGEAGP